MHRQRIVCQVAQNHDGGAARVCVGAAEGLEALAVRQREVKEDDVDPSPLETIKASRKPVDELQVELVWLILGLAEELLDQPPVPGVVLDKQDSDWTSGHRLLHYSLQSCRLLLTICPLCPGARPGLDYATVLVSVARACRHVYATRRLGTIGDWFPTQR